jgi:hypothetical protein
VTSCRQFATLYHGSAGEAAQALEYNDNGVGLDEMKAALINALLRIDSLERRVQALQEQHPNP